MVMEGQFPRRHVLPLETGVTDGQDGCKRGVLCRGKQCVVGKETIMLEVVKSEVLPLRLV